MKLLLCAKCSDVIKLDLDEERKCKCGETSGKYVNGLDAWYKGPCIPLGFNNVTLAEAARNQPKTGRGRDFAAFVIAKDCDTFRPYDEVKEVIEKG